jgi:hypothetical protein
MELNEGALSPLSDRLLPSVPHTRQRIGVPPCPLMQVAWWPSMYVSPLGIRKDDTFRGHSPTVRTFAYTHRRPRFT